MCLFVSNSYAKKIKSQSKWGKLHNSIPTVKWFVLCCYSFAQTYCFQAALIESHQYLRGKQNLAVQEFTFLLLTFLSVNMANILCRGDLPLLFHEKKKWKKKKTYNHNYEKELYISPHWDVFGITKTAQNSVSFWLQVIISLLSNVWFIKGSGHYW